MKRFLLGETEYAQSPRKLHLLSFFPHLCPLPSSCRHPQDCQGQPSGGGGQGRGLLKPAGSLCPAAATGWFQGDLLALQTKEQCPKLKQHLFKITCH